jgi:glycosyltransferase involved in cell wall biosynthesis
MRITIDATAALLRSAGVKNYIYHWVHHVRRLASSDEEIRAFPFLDDLGRLSHETSTLGVGPTLWRLAMLRMVNLTGTHGLSPILAKTDIFHASNQVHHAPRRPRLTATVYDLTCNLMPQFHTAENVLADRHFADEILSRADGIVAISENTRRDAIRLLGIVPERIATIYPGIAEDYFSAQPTRRRRAYVLYVGTIEPRKNLNTLLDAWQSIRPELRHEFELVIVGMNGWGTQATLARIRAEATYLGYVPEASLPGLIAGATAFVYPSLYEGFGFPVAQAMAAGAPVLTANSSCLPEIAGDAALFADPLSPAQLADGLTRLLESGDLRRQLIERGRQRAQRYRWEICATQSLEFFRNIGGDDRASNFALTSQRKLR